MKVIGSKLLIACFLFGSGVSFGKDVPKEKIAAVQNELKKNTYLTVDFEIDTFSALRQKHRISKGLAYFQKPGSFRWVYKEPHNTELIYDGNSLLSYIPNENRADRLRVSSGHGDDIRQIVNMVMNLEELLKRYDLEKAEMDDNYLNLVIAPKSNKKVDIYKGHLTIDTKNNFIEVVKLYTDKDNYKKYEFQNPRRNKIDPKIFALDSKVKVTDLIETK